RRQPRCTLQMPGQKRLAPFHPLTLLRDVDVMRKYSLCTSLLTFDVQGAFDYVNHGCLLCRLWDMGLPPQVIRWVASFISNCKTSICLDGVRAPMKQVSTGVPQGSPVSPILFLLFSSRLFTIKGENGEPG